MRQFDGVLLELRVHCQHLRRGAEAQPRHRRRQVHDGLARAATDRV